MALNKAALKSDLLPAFRDPEPDVRAAAQKRAAAYAKYAGKAQSCAGGSPVQAQIAAARQLLEASLTSAYTACRDLGQVLQLESAAYALFWVGMVFQSATPGAVIVPILAPALYADLYAKFLSNMSWFPPATPPDQAEMADRLADQYAGALHTATSLVVVAHPLPTLCVGPVS